MDLYSLLGVARTASVAEIDRAFRRLARRYHPGVNPGDRVSEEMYRRLTHAYDVLTDANRRRQYDLGPAPSPAQGETTVEFEGFDFSAPAEGALAATFSELFADVFHDAAREATTPTRGSDLELSARLAFADAVRGGELPLSVTRQERCPTCAGYGRVRRSPITCAVCRGEGSRRWARGHLVFTKSCEACGGLGRLETDGCRTCAGVGTSPRTEVVTLTIPAGLESGARISVPGRGHAGARGGPAGDLYVMVDVADHPYFTRHGRDLHVVLPLAIHEAAFGARVDVPTLDGRVRLRVPPGTASGARLRVLGRGVGAPDRDPAERGDLVAEVRIVLPAELDEPSRNLLKEFARRNPADVRQHLFNEG